ncbi:unnamed protein product [Caenorhabditis nigoni]
MPFPILRTPVVVISEIIILLEPNEIVTASFCSINVKRLLKRHYQQRKPLEWRLSLIDYDRSGRVNITKSIDDELTVLSSNHISVLDESGHKSIETDGYKRTFSSRCPVLYFENPVTGIQWIVDYVTDLFNLDIYGLVTDRYGTWAIDWINNRQEKMLQTFELEENNKHNLYGDEALDYVLRNARASDYYIIKDNVSDNFRFDEKLGPANHLCVDSYGHWITLDNLKNFDFVNIFIDESILSVLDLHAFLTHWRAGGSHRLKFLRLDFANDKNFENFEEELGMEIIETDNVIEYRFSNGDDWYILDGYSIQRNDGMKAVIDFDDRYFSMLVLPRSEMQFLQ